MKMIDDIIRRIEPPDIRKFYKIHRELANFFVHSAVRINDGHYDRFLTARGDGRQIPVRVYPPMNISPKRRIILFFHGGGWAVENIDRYHKVCSQLAAISGSYVISVEYRLAPENKFPAGLADCYEAARQVFAGAARRGIPSRNVILTGDSAGGNLAAAVSLASRERGEFRVRRQILIYPATACEYEENSPYKSVHEKGKGYILTAERMRGYLDLYLKDISQKNNPYVAPIKAKSFEKYPATLIITAENDPLCDEGEAFGKRLYKEGCDVMAFRIKGAYHGFFGTDLQLNPDARKAVSMMMYFIGLTD
ncbi:MAG: alpha/beta hydrolase [Oscillospiraceae bacterium]|nr:alpha/beta hydrolase [Oscillospiraceae bacterium]